MAHIRLTTKNWSEFQHYKDRAPAWIKLHRGLLDNYDWHRLPDASKALAPMIWLLASEYEGGVIDSTTEELSFRLRTTEAKFEAALKPLIEACFMTAEHDASGVLAEREQTAISEEEREEERETEEEIAFSDFIGAARKHGWPTPRAMDAGRRKKLRLRLQEHQLDGWRAMLDKAGSSDFLRTKFALKFDWILEPANFTKVIEGNYDDKGGSSKPTMQTMPADDADQWRARLRVYTPGAFWPSDWGPRPGEPGCFVPAAVLAEFPQARTQ